MMGICSEFARCHWLLLVDHCCLGLDTEDHLARFPSMHANSYANFWSRT
jgi:hypothetical protein